MAVIPRFGKAVLGFWFMSYIVFDSFVAIGYAGLGYEQNAFVRAMISSFGAGGVLSVKMVIAVVTILGVRLLHSKEGTGAGTVAAAYAALAFLGMMAILTNGVFLAYDFWRFVPTEALTLALVAGAIAGSAAVFHRCLYGMRVMNRR